MAYYTFNAFDSGHLYEVSLYAKNFRADSSGNVGFFDYSGNMIRLFGADEILIDSITKVKLEEASG